MTYETINISTDERGVATLTLDRADKHNAMSGQMIDELSSITKVLDNDAAVRVVVLAANGKSFCAGGDLQWMKDQFNANRAQKIKEATKLAMMLNGLNTLSKPLIGKIDGNAFGGGVGLIATCDIAICSNSAKFGLTETRLGLIPATISPYVIARMGENKARRVFMSARIFDATEAKELNLVSGIADDLDAAVENEILPFLTAAPKAVAASKALARSLGPRIDTATISDTINSLADVWEGEEAQEGVSAFFEKRKPNWVK